MSSLVACPFCRELFARDEAEHCPSCGLLLADLAKLPPSPVDETDDDFGIPREPHLEALPPFFMGRGRGALLGFCLLGLGAFFLPWVHMSAPDVQVLSGVDLARRAGWIWSAAVGWFVLLPLVLTRRSIDKMRGARIAAAMLSAIPAVTASVLMLFPPKSKLVPLAFQWGVGIQASLVLGVVATLVAIRFGGTIDDLPVMRGRVVGRGPTLH